MEEQYLAFMLRLWQVGHGESTVWRASLEDPHSGALRTFANVEALIVFLRETTRQQPEAGTAAGTLDVPFGFKGTR